MNTILEPQTMHRVKSASPDEADQCIRLLTHAFRADPGVRWLFRSDLSYETFFPVFVDAFGGGAFAFGTAYRTENFGSVALWLPPGAHPDEERLVTLVEQAVDPSLHQDAFALFEQMGASHPTEAHWHLTLIGTEARCRGQGLGGQLIRATLDHCDRTGVPAYLEATSPDNVRLYSRLGFTPVGRIQQGNSPVITPMVRRPGKRHRSSADY